MNTGFCVVYKFDVVQGKEQEFIDAWREMTELIYQYESSLGSRLQTSSDGTYIAYAQWPNRKTWEEFGDNLPTSATLVRDRMREACHSMEVVFELDVVNDYLKTKPFHDD